MEELDRYDRYDHVGRLQIEAGQFFDLFQLHEMLLGLDEDDDCHVADENGSGLLDDVDDFRLVDQLADEVEQRQQRRSATKEHRQCRFRRSARDVQQSHQQVTSCKWGRISQAKYFDDHVLEDLQHPVEGKSAEETRAQIDGHDSS